MGDPEDTEVVKALGADAGGPCTGCEVPLITAPGKSLDAMECWKEEYRSDLTSSSGPTAVQMNWAMKVLLSIPLLADCSGRCLAGLIRFAPGPAGVHLSPA